MSNKSDIQCFAGLARREHKAMRAERAKAKDGSEFMKTWAKEMQSYHHGKYQAFFLAARHLKGYSTCARFANAIVRMKAVA